MASDDTTADGERGVMAAYSRFFDAFNTRDPERFAGALKFPHVRVSARGSPAVVADAETHASRQDFGRIVETGWHHSVGKPGRILHLGEDKAHVLGGWTRHREDGSPIVENTVAYVATRINGDWGIQSRFGIDPGAAGETDALAEDAIACVERFLEAMNERDFAGAAATMSYPTYLIGPGLVRHWDSANALLEVLRDGPWHFLTEMSVEAVQAGPRAVNLAVEVLEDGGDVRDQALFMVRDVDGRLGIQARSIIER